jgi:ferredoxin
MKETKCPHCHKELTISLNALNTCSHCNANFYVYRDGQVIEIENPKPQTQTSNITTKPHPIVDELKCTLCEHCIKKCPQKAVYKRNGLILIDTAKCNNCRKCPNICPENAIN